MKQELKAATKRIDEEYAKQLRRERHQIVEAADEVGHFEGYQQRAKDKRDQGIVLDTAIVGGMLGALVLGGTLLFPPTAMLSLVGLGGLGGTAASITAGGIGIAVAAASTAIGYGAGHVRAKLTHFEPKIPEGQREELYEQAKAKIQHKITDKMTCTIRMKRSSGHLNHAECAEVLDVMSDVLQMEHEFASDAAEKLRNAAQEVRLVGKEEKADEREEDKLSLEKSRVDKQEQREDKREDISMKRLEQEIRLDDLRARSELVRSEKQDQFSGVLSHMASGGVGSAKPSIDLTQLAAMQMLCGGRLAA